MLLFVGKQPSSPELRREVSHAVEPPYLREIVHCLNCKKLRLLSVAGPGCSGKRVTLQSLVNKLESDENIFHFPDVKHIYLCCEPVHSTNKISFAGKLATKLGCRVSDKEDPVTVVERELHNLTKEHAMVLLIFDISLASTNSVGILAFLYDLLEHEHFANIKIVVTSLVSLKNSKQFEDLEDAAVEIRCEGFTKKAATLLIKDIDPRVSEKQIHSLLKYFGNSPYILKRIIKLDLFQKLLEVHNCDNVSFERLLENNREKLLGSLCKRNAMENSLEVVLKDLKKQERLFLAQCLVLATEFRNIDLERILDQDIVGDTCDAMLELFGPNELFILKSWTKDGNCQWYQFPMVIRKLLLRIILEDSEMKEAHRRGQKRFFKIYTDKLTALGDKFLCGEKDTKSPCLNLDDEAAMPVVDIVQSFRKHQTKIVDSLLLGAVDIDFYNACINVLTKMRILCLLNKMLLLDDQVKIYKTLKRFAVDRDDRLTMAKLDACIAYFLMYNYGFHRYTKEARELLKNALPVLEKYKNREDVVDIYINGLCKFGRCMVSEQFYEKAGMKDVSEGLNLMKDAIYMQSRKKVKTKLDPVLTAVHWRQLAGKR